MFNRADLIRYSPATNGQHTDDGHSHRGPDARPRVADGLMTLKFPDFARTDFARYAAIALAGFALLAAGPLPEAPTPATLQTLTLTADLGEMAATDDATGDADEPAATPAIALATPASLPALVAQVASLPGAPLDAEGKCLATAVFFEARGEPLAGQLAVAQVILNRVASGRYAASVCGVVYQPGQFSFARRTADTASADWRTARAIALIAQAERWLQVAPRAMAFHAARVTPRWGGMERVSRIGNHVFYR